MAVPRRSAVGAAGRHLLRSSRFAAGLVADAAVAHGDLVIEIGGGTGMLTRELVRTGATVRVIERDPALARLLRARFAAQSPVEIVEADARTYEWPTEPFAIVANLPFTGSGEILSSLLGDPAIPLRRADVIVQWEFAAKQAAVWPSTQRTIYWRAWYELSVARRLHRSAFTPAPTVDAALLRIERRSRPHVPEELQAEYLAFLRAGFSSSQPLRAALRGKLSPLLLKRLAPTLGFDPDARARDLDARQWAALFAGSDVDVKGSARRPRRRRRAGSRGGGRG